MAKVLSLQCGHHGAPVRSSGRLPWSVHTQALGEWPLKPRFWKGVDVPYVFENNGPIPGDSGPVIELLRFRANQHEE